MSSNTTREDRIWFVTGTFHGSIVFAQSEGQARRMFHAAYNGESIVHITEKSYVP